MKEIPLNLIEKQSLSVLIDSTLFELSFKLCNNVMAATIIRDGETIVENRRVVAGVGIIPEGDREEGNFIILTNNDELPYFDQFASTHVLVYANEEETIELRKELNQINVRKIEKATVITNPAIKQPVIKTQPTGGTVEAFGTITLKVVADNAVKYEWRKDGNIVGTDSDTYTDTNAQPSDSGNYRVIVTGEKYSSAVSSNTVSIAVNKPTVPKFNTQPHVWFNPVSGPYAGKNLTMFSEGGNLLIPGADVSFANSYQWQMLDSNGAWINIVSQTNAILDLPNPEEGVYRLQATNTEGTTTSQEVVAIEAFLFLQNDSITAPGAKYSVSKIDNEHYELVNPNVSASSTRLIGAFVRKTSDSSTNTVGVGINSVDGSSSNPAVASASPKVNSRQVAVVCLAVGEANVTVNYGPLSSNLHIKVT